MKERVYYRLVIELQSALTIGAADSVQTDKDVVLDSRGMPLIPATSLAGLYRSHFDEVRALEVFGEIIEGERNRILAKVSSNERVRILGTDGHRCDESAVRIYDGTWESGNSTVSVRDSVALKDKVGIDGLKFDRQAVQAGACFVTYIEIIDITRCSTGDIERVISAFDSGLLRLGSKSTRGFGRFKVVNCKRRSFDQDEVDDWLDFDMFATGDSPSWSVAEDITDRVGAGEIPGGIELRLSLELRGGVSIREYTTRPSEGKDPEPDYSQMVVHGITDKDGQDVPVIPGTSWAGAFRNRYASLADEKRARNLFGYVSQSGKKEENGKSRIVFEESQLEGGEWKLISRNAINRITGGTVDGALYTERSYFGGKTDLVIGIAPIDGFEEVDLEPLICAIADLHNGFLSVGGLTSVGRGLFRIRGAKLLVNGRPVEGFDEALLASASLEPDLIAPKIKRVASMLCAKGGEEQ